MIEVLLLIITYFVGNINFARLLSNKDCLRTEFGSKNPGTTNMFRLYGWRVGGLTFIGDFFKGMVPIFFVKYMEIDCNLYYLLVSVIVGHMYPVLYSFVGGKGVATYFGAIWLVNWQIAWLTFGCWLGVLLLSKVVAAASVSSFFIVGILSILLLPPYEWFFILLVHWLVVFQHWRNIQSFIQDIINKERDV